MIKHAYAVIGANYGDEGKGVIADYLCSELKPEVVVRFNGGAQAGHTVIHNGARHVFHHLGSGSFLGIPTFLSKYFIVNPILYWQERFSHSWQAYVDPQAIVTLPWDMLINQALAKVTGHGSCGVGINETVTRSLNPRYRITVATMTDKELFNCCLDEYFTTRLRRLNLPDSVMAWDTDWAAIYFQFAELFEMKVAKATSPPRTNKILFEGAQGLMLDQNAPDFPYVTRSNTGLKNVKQLCYDWGITNLHATYVTRSYLTRHGAGPLPNEEPIPPFVQDATNIDHPFQGKLRYAPLNILALERRVIKDSDGTPLDLAITCNDQHEIDAGRFALPVAYRSFGPTRADVRLKEKV